MPGMLAWTKPTVEGAPWFAKVGDVNVGYVSPTAFPDKRWLSVVMPRADKRLTCYAASKERAQYYAERYLSKHMPDVEAMAKERRAMRDAEYPPLPRKPKGVEGRS